MPEADEDYIKEARQELQMQNTKDQLVRVAGTIPNSNLKLQVLLSLQDIVRAMGFEYHAVLEDGDCLCHSLGAMVRVKAARLRARIVQQMAAHVDRYDLEVDLDAARDMPLYLAWLREKAGEVFVQSFEPESLASLLF